MAEKNVSADIGISQAELDKLFSGNHKEFSRKLRKFETIGEFQEYLLDGQVQKDLLDCIHHGIDNQPLNFSPLSLNPEKYASIKSMIESLNDYLPVRARVPMIAYAQCTSCKQIYSHKRLMPMLERRRSVSNYLHCSVCGETFVPYLIFKIKKMVMYTLLLSPYRTVKGIEYVYKQKFGKEVLTKNIKNIDDSGHIAVDAERGELFRYPILILNLLYYSSEKDAETWLSYKHPQGIKLFNGDFPLQALM